jgi:FAD/FMN-containing dehydrogenase
MAHEQSTGLTVLCATLLGFWWMRYWLASAPADSRVFVDDITQLNKTAVDRVFYVKTADDLKDIIAMANAHGKQVSIRGQSHTMGGQTIASDGYVIDMKYFNNVSYNPVAQTVRAEPGATWGQLIKYLNDFGMSPLIMQSYCSFSVGGTIAVNAHGITSDYGMYESVISLDVIDSTGQRLTCSRTQNRELFSLVIGGYGLFGFICEVTMKVVPNVKISMESVKLESEEFPMYYQRVLEDPSVEVKLARIDITRPQDIFLFIFRKDGDQRTVSDLDSEARVMKQMTQFLYKWAMPLRIIQRFRYFVETYASKPLDWSGENDRNLLMYESAAPLARLYKGIVSLDHTFVLQEYFIPHDNFAKWMKNIRVLLKKPFEHVTLLNITIRYLYKDDNSFLPYATNNMFAFVFYYRLKRTTTADQDLEHIHNRFVEIALSLGGTFYLPYRHHYSDEQLRQAYPRIETFFKRKAHYDPRNVFSNLWYKRYARTVVDVHQRPSSLNKQKTLPAPHFDPTIVPIVSEHRNNSYQEVFKSQVLKKKLETFLRVIFNIENPARLFSQIARIVWNPKTNTDMKVYNELQRRLNSRKFQSYLKLRNGLKTLKQISEQRTELAEETLSIVSKLGLIGSLHDYASIGDSGKMILSLRSSLGMKGTAYVVHDRQRPADFIERGSLFQVGNFVPIDYHHVEELPIPSNSVDLVTMNQGLHHLHQEQVTNFLKIVYRILRPGGVFLFREHDARPELIPILDLAHSIFNAVTGVSSDDEKHEIRAFRPMSEWRRIMTAVGFEDMYLYEMQHNDPTEDYMLCFAKPPFKTQRALDIPLTQSQEIIAEADHRVKNLKASSAQEDSTTSYYRLPEWVLVRVTQIYAKFLNHTPWYRFPYVKFSLLYWKLVLFAYLSAARFRDPLRAATNIGLIMDVIIGFVLTILFVQLWILALPLRLLYGGENPSEGESEQIIVTVPSHSNVDWPRIDARIQWQSLGMKNNSALFLLTIPKHLPFTEILLKINHAVDGIQLIEISGQRDDMQVEVTAAQKSAINPLKRLAGARYLYDYQYPTDPATTYCSLSVKISQLFAVLEELQSHAHVKVLQIYDFL